MSNQTTDLIISKLLPHTGRLNLVLSGVSALARLLEESEFDISAVEKWGLKFIPLIDGMDSREIAYTADLFKTLYNYYHDVILVEVERTVKESGEVS